MPAADGPQGLHRDAGRMHVHQEEADALVLGHTLIGARGDHANIRAVRTAGEDLLAIEPEATAWKLLRFGDERSRVGTGAGLAETPAAGDLGARDARQVFAALLLAAIDGQ